MQFKLFKHTLIFILSSLFVIYSADTSAKTKRTAYVVVKNETGRDITSIDLGHKYSDVFKEQYHWKNIKNGQETSPRRVSYNTGAFTTGRDWWLVSWVYPGSDRVYYSDPNNFRDIIDFLESITSEDGDTVLRVAALGVALCAVATGGACLGPAAATLTAVGLFTAGEFVDKSMSTDTTAGFKQHILRSEDAGRNTRITLRPNGKIKITSSSGRSDTVYSSKRPEVENREYTYNVIANKIEELQGPKVLPLAGRYENHLYDNGGKNNWHYVNIKKLDAKTFEWKNRAGVSWRLSQTNNKMIYNVSSDCPYYASGYRQAKVKVSNGRVVGIYGPGNELYKKK